MQAAYALARRLLPEFSCKFSRHDYTLSQLFACLVMREFHDVSLRRAEAILQDNPQSLADIGIRHAPDHNTLWRALKRILRATHSHRMLDLLAKLFAEARLLGLSSKPLAIDSTCFEMRHRSNHYARRCRHMVQEGEEKARKGPGVGAKPSMPRGRCECERCPSWPSPSPVVAI